MTPDDRPGIGAQIVDALAGLAMFAALFALWVATPGGL